MVSLEGRLDLFNFAEADHEVGAAEILAKTSPERCP